MKVDALWELYVSSLEARGYARSTLNARRTAGKHFLQWLLDRDLTSPRLIRRRDLSAYSRALFRSKDQFGRPMGAASRHQRLGAIRQFFSWLVKEGQLEANPAADLELPKIEKRIAGDYLTHDEVRTVIAHIDDSAIGLRDRAILEVFFSTGIRRMELVNLDLDDVHLGRRELFVRQGKGSKDRMVPIGTRALAAVLEYIEEARPKLERLTSPALFLDTRRGRRLSTKACGLVASKRLKASGVRDKGACHLFRHAMATAMLENGAELRALQVMLGHKHLTTTQIYTHVSIKRLRDEHARCHPDEAARERPDEVGSPH